ncbi:MAG: hypothetical protein ACJA1C_001035 [Crocinitomicaceae bacterium]|jgi:hypothetical protein
MKYNIYISAFWGKYNVFDITEEKLLKVVDAYKLGKENFTLSGTKFSINKLSEFKVFTSKDSNIDPPEIFMHKLYLGKVWKLKNMNGTPYLPPQWLSKLGDDVTDEFIGDVDYGEGAISSESHQQEVNDDFVDVTRIATLKALDSNKFDLSRLIAFCDEINDNYKRENYYSVAMIGRSILNHVPPVFKCENFETVTKEYGSSSFRKNMKHLDTSLRGIADSYVHSMIRSKELKPTKVQVNYSQDLDLLLDELIRIIE